MDETRVARVLIWYPTAMLNCPCQEGVVSLIVTTGFNNPSMCGHCRRLYSISAIAPAELGALPEVMINVTVPTPIGKVM